LNKSLKRHGFRSGEIHGDIDQAARQRELEAFKTGEINLLVASDVAARGLDIKGVSHVFNFDAPWHPDDYVHRIGRTGRAGAKGKAFTFVTKADEEAIDNIEKLIGLKIERLGKVSAPKEEREATPKKETERRSSRGGRAKGEEAEKAEKPEKRQPRPEKAAAPAPPPRDKAPRAKSDEGGTDWNGPMPDFLNFSIPA
jgi:superfamily II DNA/RNA helicase